MAWDRESELASLCDHLSTLAHGGVNNWGAAFLPAHCQGTPIGNASWPPARPRSSIYSQSAYRCPTAAQATRSIAAVQSTAHGTRWSRCGAGRSIEFIRTGVPHASYDAEVQDLSAESAQTHKLYGIDDPVTENFGRQCLMARRFLEAGVRFVQVTHSDSEVQWTNMVNCIKAIPRTRLKLIALSPDS